MYPQQKMNLYWVLSRNGSWWAWKTNASAMMKYASSNRTAKKVTVRVLRLSAHGVYFVVNRGMLNRGHERGGAIYVVVLSDSVSQGGGA